MRLQLPALALSTTLLGWPLSTHDAKRTPRVAMRGSTFDEPSWLCDEQNCVEGQVHLTTDPAEMQGMHCVLQEGLHDADGKPIWACLPVDVDQPQQQQQQQQSPPGHQQQQQRRPPEHHGRQGQPAPRRRDVIASAAATAAAASTAAAVRRSAASAADLAELANRPRAPAGQGSLVYEVLAAQAAVKKLLDDEDTFRTMVSIGLPTPAGYVPPQLSFSLFKKLEGDASDPGVFMDAAIEYVEYARDASDLVELARLSRTNGAGPAATQDYLDRALIAARGAGKALQRMVPLLPGQDQRASNDV